ncbi:MAG: hypothetical protein ACREF6_18950, partial [Alphaproteobacteria bacterium]
LTFGAVAGRSMDAADEPRHVGNYMKLKKIVTPRFIRGVHGATVSDRTPLNRTAVCRNRIGFASRDQDDGAAG